MCVTIREARKEDISGLHKVMLEISDFGVKDFALGEKMVEEIARDNRQQLLVAISGDTGEVLGSAYGIVFPDICDNGRPILLVENVAVAKESQGQGVGRKLMDALEQFGHTHDCHYEMLVSGPERVGAHKFYKALGFEEKKAFKKYFE